jgi:hypothetical protein
MMDWPISFLLCMSRSTSLCFFFISATWQAKKHRHRTDQLTPPQQIQAARSAPQHKSATSHDQATRKTAHLEEVLGSVNGELARLDLAICDATSSISNR